MLRPYPHTEFVCCHASSLDSPVITVMRQAGIPDDTLNIQKIIVIPASAARRDSEWSISRFRSRNKFGMTAREIISKHLIPPQRWPLPMPRHIPRIRGLRSLFPKRVPTKQQSRHFAIPRRLKQCPDSLPPCGP